MKDAATVILSINAAGVDTDGHWIQLLPAGTAMGRDGRGPYYLDDAHAVVAATMNFAAGRIPIDYEH